MDKFFEKTYNLNKITFSYTRGKSVFSGNETHPYHEIIYYPDVSVILVSKNLNDQLAPGSLVIIPAKHRHRFFTQNHDTFSRLIISFPHVPEEGLFVDDDMADIKIIRTPNHHITHILTRMCDIIRNKFINDAEKHLYCNFLALLSEVSLCSPENNTHNKHKHSDFIISCVKYIDQNYKTDISAEQVAKEMNVSRSTIFRRFKEEFGMSFHKYVQKKRLLNAHSLITEGDNPTSVCFESGFNDYSSFYKAYVKEFGCSPSSSKG